MTTVININRALIFEGISKITGFIGKNVENGLDRIAVTEDERNIIDDLIRSSIISMTAFVSAYHPVLNDNGITIETPSNFDRAASEALQSEMETYIINHAATGSISQEKKTMRENTANMQKTISSILTYSFRGEQDLKEYDCSI